MVGLPQRNFPNGMQFFTQMYSKKDTALVHNNYIIGYEQKLARFKNRGLWLVKEALSEPRLRGGIRTRLLEEPEDTTPVPPWTSWSWGGSGEGGL